ncbi:MAG: tetratricopeptide repeat protein [Deltaproteobacteria bacterium]|nr:tetratricopeptide repeat protein [Deltaproteobacteria bacterium]
MNKVTCLFLALVFLTWLAPPPSFGARIVIDSEDQFAFARQVMEKGEYVRAVVEFERFIHFFPEEEKVPEARYFIGLCYLEARDYASAGKALEGVHRTYAPRPVAGKALLMIGELYYRQGAFEEAERYFKRVVREYPQPEVKNPALYRLGWSQMQTNRWQEASRTFSDVEKESPLYAGARRLSDHSLQGEALPRKDPVAAGLLAGAIPGLGHLYCDRPKDGLVSFLLNGVFIWAAVESFQEDHDVLGGILTFMELGWYSGNIYSAVNCAHKYNRKVQDDFRRGLSDRMSLGVLNGAGGHLGLALKIDF